MLGLGSVNTAKKYVEYLENTFLIFTVPLYAYSVRKQIANPRKVYGIDNGILRFASFRFSENKGRFLENIVFIELKRRKQEVYYYRTNNGLEVDFLLKEGTKVKELIQVSQSLAREEVKKRELNALRTAMQELKVKKGLLLTENEEEEIAIGKNTIKIMPIYKWLLE
jgi:predicted AAA+ superfamily ATPase